MLVSTGRLQILKEVTGQAAVEAFRLGLYVNSVAWTKDTVIANLTEPVGGGYARQNVSGWNTPTTLPGGEGDTTAVQVTFSNTAASAVVVNGFFFVGASTGILYGGDAFPSPLTIPATIGTLSIVPELTDTTYP